MEIPPEPPVPPGGGQGQTVAVAQPSLERLGSFSTEELIAILAPLLEQLMERNDQLPLTELTSFHARSCPPISILSYLQRFVQYAPSSNECFILLLIYLDRISQHNPVFCLTSLNAHRMIVTGLVLAAKFSQDKYYTNSHYARVGGLPLRELNALELEFLTRIGFSLWADPDLIDAYFTQLLHHTARNKRPLEDPAVAAAKRFKQQQDQLAAAQHAESSSGNSPSRGVGGANIPAGAAVPHPQGMGVPHPPNSVHPPASVAGRGVQRSPSIQPPHAYGANNPPIPNAEGSNNPHPQPHQNMNPHAHGNFQQQESATGNGHGFSGGAISAQQTQHGVVGAGMVGNASISPNARGAQVTRGNVPGRHYAHAQHHTHRRMSNPNMNTTPNNPFAPPAPLPQQNPHQAWQQSPQPSNNGVSGSQSGGNLANRVSPNGGAIPDSTFHRQQPPQFQSQGQAGGFLANSNSPFVIGGSQLQSQSRPGSRKGSRTSTPQTNPIPGRLVKPGGCSPSLVGSVQLGVPWHPLVGSAANANLNSPGNSSHSGHTGSPNTPTTRVSPGGNHHSPIIMTSV